jgi:hypothetical protein
MAGIDFRLPLSNTSTHKSVNPSLLRIITSNGTQEYDGSTLVEVNVSGSTVAAANALANSVTISISGGAITSSGATFDGANNTTIAVTQLDADYMTKGTLGVKYGGTGKTTWTAGALIYASAATTLGQIAVGNAGEILTQTANGPAWTAINQIAVGAASSYSGGAVGSADRAIYLDSSGIPQ